MPAADDRRRALRRVAAERDRHLRYARGNGMDDRGEREDGVWGPRDEPPAGHVGPGGPPGGFQELDRPADAPDPIDLTKSELSALRAHLDVVFGQIAEELAGIHDDSVAAAEARVEGAESRLSSRLDEIAATVQTAQGSAVGEDVVARREALEARVEQLQVALDQQAASGGEAAVRIDSEIEGLGLTQDDLSRRLDGVIERLEKLQASGALKAQRRELEAALRDGLAEIRSSVAVPEGSGAARLQALEEHARESTDEMSELNDLHAALDVGLGSLRSEIAELRNTMRKIVADQADSLDRPQPSAQLRPVGEIEQGRSRRKDRKGPVSEMAALLVATENLARGQQQLKADVADLEQEARLARATSSRAAAEPPGLNALRRDITELREQVAAQDEALETLRKAVDAKPAAKAARPPARPPAAKRAPRTTKG